MQSDVNSHGAVRSEEGEEKQSYSEKPSNDELRVHYIQELETGLQEFAAWWRKHPPD